jgi:hypothetical protein
VDREERKKERKKDVTLWAAFSVHATYGSGKDTSVCFSRGKFLDELSDY